MYSYIDTPVCSRLLGHVTDICFRVLIVGCWERGKGDLANGYLEKYGFSVLVGTSIM